MPTPIKVTMHPLYRFRERHGLSRRQLANRAIVSPPSVEQEAWGEATVTLNRQTARSIADVLEYCMREYPKVDAQRYALGRILEVTHSRLVEHLAREGLNGRQYTGGREYQPRLRRELVDMGIVEDVPLTGRNDGGGFPA